MKKLTIIIFVSIVLFITIYSLLVRHQTDIQSPPSIIPTVSQSPQILNRITIQGVAMTNFLEKSKTIEKTGEVFVIEKDDYIIVYNKISQSFLIDILSSPFDTTRATAEKDFLNYLGITQEDACKLIIIENTPYFANPQDAGKDYGLNFCQ